MGDMLIYSKFFDQLYPVIFLNEISRSFSHKVDDSLYSYEAIMSGSICPFPKVNIKDLRIEILS
jgi:hypothetical protein